MNKDKHKIFQVPENIKVIMNIRHDGTEIIIDVKNLSNGDMYISRFDDIEYAASTIAAIYDAYMVDVAVINTAGYGLAVYDRICNLPINIIPLKCRKIQISSALLEK